ncbi:MAG: histidine triad nucleotide-binding protein [Gemmatimonadetes bacterium]|nr:histidine triad nucleotide-binding protein [Gemmatimonadota bacterium]
MSDCIFCKIARGEIPAKVVRKSPDAVAFHDLTPQAPVHVLVIPTKHFAAVRDAAGVADSEAALGKLLVFAAEVATELGLDQGGYRIVTNTGPDAGQSVHHLHLHLLGGRRLGWPPG